MNAQSSSSSSDVSQPTSQSHDSPSQSVLIVGGGHVGLSFALLLAYYGIASTIIEKNTYPKISPDDDDNRSQYLDSRNTALSRRTVQIYQSIGLWDKLASHACRIDQVHISELGSFGQAKLIKEEEGLESFGQVMENAWLGRKLLLAVQDSELIQLMDGTTLTAIEQQPKQVTVSYEQKVMDEQVEGKDGNNKAGKVLGRLSADLLVACDGRDSVARQLLGIASDVYDYQQTGIVGVVTTNRPHNHVAIERFSSAGPLAVLPLPGVTDACNEQESNQEHDGLASYRRSVVWICPKGEEKAYLEDDAYFLQTLQQTFGEQAGKFLQTGRRGAYPLTKVLAERQVQGRCVIMGNAAHTLHPVAGQGFNLCMRDAETLAKMLAGQVMRQQDIGSPQLLQAYQQARQKDQKQVIKFCDAVVHGFTHKNPAVKFVRNLGLLAFDKIPKVKPLVATYAMGLKS